MAVGPSLTAEEGCGHRLFRWLFIIFNVIFSIIAIGLVGVGSYGVAKAKSMNFNEILENIEIPEDVQTEANIEGVRKGLVAAAAFVIIVGLLTLFISSCGWIGACKQNKCLLFSFSVSMVTIVVIEFILAIVVFVAAKKISSVDGASSDDWVEKIMEVSIKEHNKTESAIKSTWEIVQEKGKCCGVSGRSDWGENVPEECEDFTEGCFDVYQDVLKKVGKSMGAVAITFCVIEIIGVVISCYLACTMSKSSHYEQH